MNSAVVIPTRDRGPLLGRAVESALRQTLPVREVIVVDDGSLDDTANIVRALARSDDRVRLVVQDGASGAAAARNRGVRETEAEWICFLDSDDTWEPRKHEAQAEAIAGTPGAVACFTGLRYAYRERSFDVLPPALLTTLDLRGANVVGSTSSAMIRRETFDVVGGFDPNLPSCQDWDLWIKLHQVGEFAMVREALVMFTQDGTDRISKNREAVFAGHRVVFDRALQGLDDRGQRARVQARHYYRMAQILLEDMDEPVGAAQAAFRSLARRPTRMAARMFLRAAKGALA
jgi:glycosyltransferase involved in cell wall biosynthesis